MLTYADVKGPVSLVLNKCADDARVMGYVNQACERLMWGGKWKGTYGRFVVKATNALITWPREIETIEKLGIEGVPYNIRSPWYEFLEHGPGLLSSDSCLTLESVDRGYSPIQYDIEAADIGPLKLTTTFATDANKIVFIQGNDQNGSKVYTEYPVASTKYIAGRNVTLGGSPVTTPDSWSFIRGIQKAVTQGPVKLEVVPGGTGTPKLLALYEPDETTPEYRRSLIPSLLNSNETEKEVIVIGKLKFIPVRSDLDWVIPSNIAAVKLMARSIFLEEQEKIKEAAAMAQLAYEKLELQLRDHMGSGVNNVINVTDGNVYGASGIIHVQ
mgnify:CR=1 FL=1